MTAFFDRLADRIADIDSVVSVGLDPDPDRLPEAVRDADLPRWAFNRRIVDATHEHAAVFKPNAAFYEDPAGWRALEKTVEHAREKGVPVLLDAKRADIGNTSRQYAKVLDSVDAITLNPFLGRDSLAPFLDREEAGCFLLCRTSNPGGADVQELELASGDLVYERVADLASEWNEQGHGNVGLVVGATTPDELRAVRERVPDLPFLVPGVGAQGGDVAAAARCAAAANGAGLVNSTRGIIFAGEDSDRPFDEAAGEAAADLKERLNEYR
ncbi:orotidine-5'-phosphate decarboxylase [Halorussus salilacus]|uniref:orotidine-5'-phosphate decarboxylase n=1 Tax=Halorussus salilacus TaxID=2953750 RepID=UPI00209CC7BA|nr:orotidine-5'-phosphate decarboxylase [Halorussus salilacus]USZ68955.1 orotidine-5'-phosphate decarboxylase [Halorussus salilacus]